MTKSAFSFPIAPITAAQGLKNEVFPPHVEVDLTNILATVTNEGWNEQAQCDIYMVVLTGEHPEYTDEHRHFVANLEVRVETLGWYANNSPIIAYEADAVGDWENIPEGIDSLIFSLCLNACKTAVDAGW